MTTRGPLLLLLFATLSSADEVDDVIAGDGVRFLGEQVSMDGHAYTAGDWALPKAAGSLDLDVPFTRFGIPYGGTLHASGSRSGNTITWTIDQWLSPDYASGDTHFQHLWGTVVARASYLLGSADIHCSGLSCAYGVLLRPAPGSSLNVHGYQWVWPGIEAGFDKTIAVSDFTGVAGLPRPVLSSLSFDLLPGRCASSDYVVLPGWVNLATPAPSSGARVQMWTTDAAQLATTAPWVAPGETSARFHVVISPGWASSAQISAAAGGVTLSQLVSSSSCYFLKLPYKALLVNTVARPIALADDGSILLRYAGHDTRRAPDGSETNLDKLLGTSGSKVLGWNHTGDWVGTATLSNGAVGFRYHPKDSTQLVMPKVSPLAVTPLGAVLASDSYASAWYLVDRSGPVEQKYLSGASLTNAVANGRGQIAASIVGKSGTEPVLLSGGSMKTLGLSEGTAVGITPQGVIYGHGKNPQGVLQAFSWSAASGLVWLPPPSGCLGDVTVSDVNDSGWLVGTAKCGAAVRAYILEPGGSASFFDKLVGQATSATFDTAIALNDLNQALVQGKSKSGATVTYLVSP